MIHAMKRGREVEFPFGKLKRVKRHFSKLWDAVDDWPANRDPHTIVHEVDEVGDRELHPWAWPKTGAVDARSRRSMNSVRGGLSLLPFQLLKGYTPADAWARKA
jgi:hypothetical protein